MRFLLFLFTFSLPLLSQTQILSDDVINASQLTNWLVSSTDEYEGSYSFGFSEGESQFIIAVDNKHVCAQLQYYEWEDSDPENIGWISVYTNYTDVKIVGNSFYSAESNGRFVTYFDGKDSLRGLVLLKSPLGMGNEGEYELGLRFLTAQKDITSGKYRDTYWRVFSESELMKYTLDELQIMRNEIFARYGYEFRAGGKMDTYFSKQKWYTKAHTNVDDFITSIEKSNIDLIQAIEKRKKE